MTHPHPTEIYISVDTETAGPNPGQYSLLSIGACTLPGASHEPQETFYAELQPVNDHINPEAYAVHGLSLEVLKKNGLAPSEAMQRFDTWLHRIIGAGERPVFVGFNAPFDWMFINEYFLLYLGHNPFGHSALDVKAFFMGLTGLPWGACNFRHITERYAGNHPLQHSLTHNALQDAQDQAVLFALMLSESRYRSEQGEVHDQ